MKKSYKKALVTGSGGDLGRGLCRDLAARGIEVVALGRSVPPVAKLEEELKGTIPFSSYFVDNADLLALEETVTRVISDHPDIDLVFLNAGIDDSQAIDEFDWRKAKRVIDVNLISNYVILGAIAPHFLSRENGHIVGISSLAAFAGTPYQHVYCASKAGMRMMLDGVRAELHGQPVAVTAVYPGFMEGRMVDANSYNTESNVVPISDAVQLIMEAVYAKAPELLFPQEMVPLIRHLLMLPAENRDETVRGLMK